MAIPIAQAITGLLNNTPSSTTGNGTRVPWVFTSALRQRVAEDRARLDRVRARFPDLATATIDPGPDEAFVVGPSVSTAIEMAINPNSVEWNQPKRWVKKDVRNGSVFFHFTNSKGQNNDVLTLRFRGNTGNIDTRGDLSEPRTDYTGALRKLQLWHNLYLLTREPILMSNNRINTQFITLSSQLLPQPIQFSGFYSEVLAFAESADKPNSRDYNFEFVVTGTDPDLDTIVNDVLTSLTETPATATSNSSLFGDGVTSTGG